MIAHEIDDAGSFAWLAQPADMLERASCALAVAGGCLVVDPVDATGLDDALAPIGPVAGVVTLLDRHRRDAGVLAERHAAPLLIPRALGGSGLALAGTEERTVISRPGWREALLWLPARRLLVCAETLGTGSFFLAREGERLGVHPLARLTPPRKAFARLDPETIAVGHGPPVVGDASVELERVLRTARRDLPRAWSRTAALAWRARGGSG
jgi:hypothetical protein